MSRRTGFSFPKRAQALEHAVRSSIALGIALLFAMPSSAPASEDEPPDQLRISVDFPGAGQRVGGVGGLGLIAGRVVAYQGRLDRFDVVFLIDVSGSTASPSGIEPPPDAAEGAKKPGLFRRVFGRRKKTGTETILGAELAAVRALLDQLDPRSTRAGLVIFSGDDRPGTPDALVEVPLTDDYARVRAGLDEIALVPPEGATNMAAGLRTALDELVGPVPRRDSKRSVQRFIVFLTDGEPMLPNKSAKQATADALRIVDLAAKRDVRISSFAVGSEAADRPEVPSEAARRTGGRFVAVRDLDTLSAEVGSVRFTGLASLALRNRTLDAAPSCQIVTPEGRFAALLPMQVGANQLEVRARSTLDTEASSQLDVQFAPGAPLISALDDNLRDDLIRLRTLCESDERRAPDERSIEIEPEQD
jgi:hypothetical protein